jgi:hypothetical protein
MSTAGYQASITSECSYSARNSREQLVPKSSSLSNNHVQGLRAQGGEQEVVRSVPVAIEQKRSYGIGGAGNIRMYFRALGRGELLLMGHIGRPSDVIYPPRLNADGSRKRAMAWSGMSTSPGSSPESKRATLFGLFSRRVSLGGVPAKENEEHMAHVKGADSGKKEN